MRTLALLVLLAITLSAFSQAPQGSSFMTVTASRQGVIKGAAARPREGQIELVGFSFNVAKSPRAELGQLVITKLTDKTTPLLWTAFGANEVLKININGWEMSLGGSEQQTYSLQFNNARIVGFKQDKQSFKGEALVEEYTLVYESVQYISAQSNVQAMLSQGQA